MTPEPQTFDIQSIAVNLPAEALLSPLHATLSRQARNGVIQSPPGTGKTTVLPPFLANLIRECPDVYPQQGPVLVTAPRRVAVRAAARRLAHLDGSRLGEKVGFTVRGEHHQGTHVQFLTPGVLIRRLLADPELAGVSAVIIDEVHERQLDTDLIIGMLTELSQLRDDFSLIAMSATLDAAHFATLLSAEVFVAEAPLHPLNIRYLPGTAPRLGAKGVNWDYLDHLAQVTDEAVSQRQDSALVFLPGVREIDYFSTKLSALGQGEVYPLHGRLTPAEQDRALARSDRPRIVVSTPVAESSLTVPGVRIVVDSGLSRSPRRDAARGMTGLVTSSCAQSSAEQRAGRAGREGPGEVIRGYSQEDFSHFTPFTTPEIQSADLTQSTLWLACWGTPGGEGLPLLTPPPAPALQSAEATLRAIGAIDDTGGATALGKRLSTLPLSPQFGVSLLSHGPQAAEVLAVIAGDPRGDVEKQVRASQGSRSFGREVSRLRRLAPEVSHRATAGQVIGTALPGLIARREKDMEYLLATGTRATLMDKELAGAPWLAIADISRSGSRAIIRAAARITEDHALEIIGVTDLTRAAVRDGKVQARKIRAAGAIELSATPAKPTPDDAAAALTEAISREGLGLFTFSDKAMALLHRLQFLYERIGDPWPDIAAADVHMWLGPELEQIARGTPISRIDMFTALQRLLPWPEASTMDELAPSHLRVPSGNRHRLDYADGRPVVRVKLQECFGLAASPEFCHSPVQFHLLSPAGRPLAVTDDLASFWSGPYTQVRAEMRGRYPRHPWPEDPWSAPATARTKNRM
ncbi:MAG: ATP-dependent helicase HrpB [Corynebacterium sp.]|uniref:ATP-dependent helicase HrpB n=1 Tax=uncultured Corynebacterium sp. TaxID=159447 RepID=UPI0018476F73|nr:ATP-dependent helicase HrpB [uncultured Corynebacterium sp.]NLZ57046.1 ATP-dependent helicase HrpB [Corynebacterium sp.]